ncbi:MAG: CaiB/BaiF CoA transferase family protein [Hyphomicrobiaceae bacterium]
MSGPLSGIRVIDLTSVVSGPVSAAILAEQGADVIKVETPTGDPIRRSRAQLGDFSPMFIACNRGKRSIALDLKKPEAAEVLWLLIDKADVLIQNFRPGAIERLGYGEPEVRKRNSGIIYMSISGVGEKGPDAKKRVYDPLIQALSGLADIQADPMTLRPRMVRTIIADKATAVYAAQAITAALFHRERTGQGQHVRLSMLDTMLSYLWPEGMADYSVVGHEAATSTNSSHDMIFEASDGYLTVGTNSDREWTGLCQALNRSEWRSDPRFKTPALRSTNRQARLLLLEEVLRENTVAHWLGVLDAADVPCAPVLRRQDIAGHPQVKASGSVITRDQQGVGKVRFARAAARFDATPPSLTGQAPYLGEHTSSVLSELGYCKDAIRKLCELGAVQCHSVND